MWAALKHSLDILIGRKMNRNSDRVNTLYRSRIRASQHPAILISDFDSKQNVTQCVLRVFTSFNRPNSSPKVCYLYTNFEMLTDRKTFIPYGP
ncbi:hypothetical protein HanXRQr2_Chr12g0552711 [Helianthus annuus]|uniref:Uncharacterized protein n=1 Tax=Helianthus annuus TaxID=4232 RepID=A0A9K3HIG2_HELAN|nr:hypothetical protein HanXRQr2_Chr12g0552711 [Helianthus annuus]KAJ0863616.1 hypothetical protein HanPSC8_Chr12g0532131 [Helianthus annuus]